MDINIRPMAAEDRLEILSMMRVFYSSPAVLSNGSEEIFESDFQACVSDNPYLEGYVIQRGNDILGYSMIAKSFSTEFGKPCIWIEDLFLTEESRGLGLGRLMISYIEEKYQGAIFRLEVEEENERAMRLYRKCGFDVIPYTEMKK